MTQASQLLSLDPKLVFDLAAQVDPPHVVAANYGLDPQFLAEMLEMPHVKQAILQKRKELKDVNYAVVAKARLMVEDLLPDIYRRAKSENATLSGVLEAAKFLRTVGGLDKLDVNTAVQEKFSITIQFSNAAPGYAPSSVIDVEAQEVLPAPPTFLQKETTMNLSDLAYDEP